MSNSGPIKEQVKQSMKTALKAGDKDTLAFARNLHSAIRKKEIDDRVDLDDPAVIKVISSQVKQRQESISQFKKGGRDDLVQKEEAELKFLQQYLPAQLSQDELKKIVQEAVAEAQASSPKEMGKVMKIVIPKIQGRADGKVVSQLVRETLNS